MSLMVIENSSTLGTPFECPICAGIFYFDNDYIKHKCKRRKF